MLREADAEWELKATSVGTEQQRGARPGGTSGWKPVSFGVGGKSRSVRNTPGGGGLEGCRPRRSQEPGAQRVAMETDAAPGPRQLPGRARLPRRGLHLSQRLPEAWGGSSGSRLRAPPVAYLLRAREASWVEHGSPGHGASGLAAGAELRAGRAGRGARASTRSTRKRAGGWGVCSVALGPDASANTPQAFGSRLLKVYQMLCIYYFYTLQQPSSKAVLQLSFPQF